MVSDYVRCFFCYRLTPEFYSFLYVTLSFVIGSVRDDEYKDLLLKSSSKVISTARVVDYTNWVKDHIVQLKVLVQQEKNRRYLNVYMQKLTVESHQMIAYLVGLLELRMQGCSCQSTKDFIFNRWFDLHKMLELDALELLSMSRDEIISKAISEDLNQYVNPSSDFINFNSLNYDKVELRSMRQNMTVRREMLASALRISMKGCVTSSASIVAPEDTTPKYI